MPAPAPAPTSAPAPAKYAIGIDLGTTNTVLAYASLADEQPKVEVMPLPQLTAASTVEARPLLPSFLYLSTEAETKAGNLDLPWRKRPDHAVGAYAARQAADVPTRTVASAKSWLCVSRVDRRQPILPWNAPPEVPKVSPLDASRRYLEHVVAAWNAAFPDAPFVRQQVVLTVPASFDASARDLTREAALAAGLPEGFLLLEEPQAALYAWLADAGEKWRRHLKIGDRILVCDVGGGTTDFTLIEAGEEGGELSLRRIAVGNHTLVGGDNMDLALAHHLRAAFSKKGVELDPWQSVALWHSCRAAKEALLGDGGPAKHPVAILGRGSKLVGGTVSVDLARAEASSLLLEGFFPACALSDAPARPRVSGFREIGLPYEADTAVTRHLAAFLSMHGAAQGGSRPTHILWSGGAFKATAFRERLLEVLASWFGGGERGGERSGGKDAGKGDAVRPLEGLHDLDFAVARGAAYYGVAKGGRGMRIRGGTARSYYVGIETAGPAIPGAPRPLRALCVVPIGMEEGTEADVPGDEIGLVVGEPAHFRFFSSAVRKQDRPGAVLSSFKEPELAETDSMESQLKAAAKGKGPAAEEVVPVRFHSRITELGVLELWCVSTTSEQRWKLEFSVRADATT
ncbi:MAG: Hsp70 family protein [Planctomycetes bacterium]|nr:Hsp70 family protein [Planctomycetota bacterium]